MAGQFEQSVGIDKSGGSLCRPIWDVSYTRPFASSVGLDNAGTTFSAGDGLMEAKTAATANSLDDTFAVSSALEILRSQRASTLDSAHPAPSFSATRAGRRLLKVDSYIRPSRRIEWRAVLQSGFGFQVTNTEINRLAYPQRKNHLTHHGIFSTQWHNLLAIRRASHVHSM